MLRRRFGDGGQQALFTQRKGALNQITLNPAAAIARPMTDCGSPRISGFTNRLEAIGFSEADFRGGCKTSVEGSVA